MRPNLSSLASSIPVSKFFSKALHFPLKQPTAPRRPSHVHVSNSCNDRPKEILRIGDPQPPWLVHPPLAAPSGETPLVGFQAQASAVGIPFSLRLVQLKKKRMNSRRAQPAPADLGALGNAVRSLASALEEIQRSVILNDDDDDDDRTRAGAPADAADSIVWLFQKVFYTSPDLVVRLLVLVADFLAMSTKKQIPDAAVVVVGAPEAVAYKCWSDVGILDEDDESSAFGHRYPDYKRRRATAYENMIASGMTGSLILSNYAQLLYQYGKDLNRANYYFRLAVVQEPPDAEAMSKYAFFLWHGLGDLEAAEEMFLRALEADPKNNHHGSSYAWFLWNTGGLDTCYPLGEGSGAGGDADGEEL